MFILKNLVSPVNSRPSHDRVARGKLTNALRNFT